MSFQDGLDKTIKQHHAISPYFSFIFELRDAYMEVADMIYMRNMITLGKANIPQAVVTGENIPLGGFVPSTPTVNTEEALWGVGGLAAYYVGHIVNYTQILIK